MLLILADETYLIIQSSENIHLIVELEERNGGSGE